MQADDDPILQRFLQTKQELMQHSPPRQLHDPSTAAAMLVLAAEFRAATNELQRIAQVLGADEHAEKIAQSDTPSTMLSLLAALKATQRD